MLRFLTVANRAAVANGFLMLPPLVAAHLQRYPANSATAASEIIII